MPSRAQCSLRSTPLIEDDRDPRTPRPARVRPEAPTPGRMTFRSHQPWAQQISSARALAARVVGRSQARPVARHIVLQPTEPFARSPVTGSEQPDLASRSAWRRPQTRKSGPPFRSSNASRRGNAGRENRRLRHDARCARFQRQHRARSIRRLSSRRACRGPVRGRRFRRRTQGGPEICESGDGLRGGRRTRAEQDEGREGFEQGPGHDSRPHADGQGPT